ncbi:MAG TPA: type II 3-dehydroquinate dehydratase [Longimicrobiales bacterium]|nr:type II 3-dehydroquinate dehydratase [Longimicrobiales bacterium]
MRVGVLHGPNLDLLGTRQPDLYGTTTLAEIDSRLRDLAEELGVELDTLQSNHEGILLDWVRDGAPSLAGYVVNAAAYTHTSVALLDALVGVDRPYVEVHLTNLAARSRTRRRSLLAAHAVGVITGFGARSYELGLRALVAHVRDSTGNGGGPTGSERGG